MEGGRSLSRRADHERLSSRPVTFLSLISPPRFIYLLRPRTNFCGHSICWSQSSTAAAE